MKNWYVAPIFLLAAAALAQTPTDFRSSAPVTTAGKDALQRLALPMEAYRDAKPDLADLRVFNAAGEAMPMAFAGDPEATKEARPAVGMAIFPLMAPPSGREEPPLDVRVKVVRDGTIVSVSGSTAAKPDRTRRAIAWLIDATPVKDPIRDLVIDWNSGPGTEVARVTVEASDDLRSWRTVASRAPLLRVEQGGQVIAQRKVPAGYVKAKYLRVTGEPAAFVLSRIEAEPEAIVRPAPRLTVTLAAKPGAKPGEYVFDAGARLPVEALRLVVGPNSVAPVSIATRQSEAGPAQSVTNATFYRLTREDVELQSQPVDIGRRSARYWVVQLDARSPPLGARPSLELQWRPAQLVFVARGEGQFALAFGDPDAKSNALAVTQLIPDYKRLDEMKLAEAKVGEVRTGERSHEWLRAFTSGANPKKIALWSILVIAVIVLGFMAMRLSRQVANETPPPQADAP